MIAALVIAGSALISCNAPTTYDDNTTPLAVMGYRVYTGPAPGTYPRVNAYEGSGCAFSVADLAPGQWYFAVTALDAKGNESVLSNVASKGIPPESGQAPGKAGLSVVTQPDAAATTARAFNFRAGTPTCAALVDAPAVAVLATPYTATRGYGWEGTAPESRDRACTLDARLAGVNQLVSGGDLERTFRVDVPPGSTVRVRLAAGDATAANRAYFELRDGSASLYAPPDRAVTPGQFVDALGVTRTTADWLASVSLGGGVREVTVTSGVLRVVLKRPAQRSSVLAHLSVEVVQ